MFLVFVVRILFNLNCYWLEKLIICKGKYISRVVEIEVYFIRRDVINFEDMVLSIWLLDYGYI